jgi:hypothetical protein
MLPTKTHQPTLSLMLPDQPDDRAELSRLMAAAVINPKFCDLLLKDPDTAIRNGFQGEEFNFSDGERDLILSIRSNSLTDLANQLSRTFDNRLPMISTVQKTDSYIL